MGPLEITLIVIAGITLLFTITTFIFGGIFFNVAFRRRKGDENFAETENHHDKNAPERKWLWSQNIEEINIVSYDKLNLKGYFIDNHGEKLAILVHGYHGRYYSLTKQAKFLFESGYSLLMINNRCHDTSEGKFMTMGKREVKDLHQWINLMIERNPNYKITLLGASMGAHIVMMMEGEKLPDNMTCIVADSGYSSLYDQMRFTYNQTKGHFKRYVVWAANVYSLLFYHFSFRNDTKNAFKKARLPLLILHGDKDNMVPYYNLEMNAMYLPKGLYYETLTFHGDDHLEGIKHHFDEYKDTVLNFVEQFNK